MRPSPEFPPVVVSSVTIVIPEPDDRPQVVCYATVHLNDAVRVCGCKLIRCADGRVRFFGPHRRDREGKSYCVVHALDGSVRRLLEVAVLDAYRAYLVEREANESLGRVARYEMARKEAPRAFTA